MRSVITHPFNVYEGNSDTLLSTVLGNYLSVTNVSHTVGSINGNTPVTLQGWGFNQNTHVFFDGAMGLPADKPLPSQITVVTPPHAAGTVNVVVRNLDNQSATASPGFTYQG